MNVLLKWAEHDDDADDDEDEDAGDEERASKDSTQTVCMLAQTLSCFICLVLFKANSIIRFIAYIVCRF